MIDGLDILEDIPLAPRTTLELGGPARFYLAARDEATVGRALAWAAKRGIRVAILGGGSNLVVGDAGFDGLVVEMAQRGAVDRKESGHVAVTAAAGEGWDELVQRTVDAGLAGLECLSGIPGRVGASPIQNVGAYGQEVSETIRAVRVLDRRSLEVLDRSPRECAFAYRDSAFKREPDRFVVLAVTFALRPGGAPAVRYAELQRALADTPAPSLAAVRDTVIALRRQKSMVIDPADANRRSAGSFFTNPIVSTEDAERVVRVALDEGLVAQPEDVPRWPTDDGRVKLAAGWLIERAGVQKGERHGPVGISTRHALALVHHGGGTTAALLALAEAVAQKVRARFDVALEREPVLWE